MEAVLQVYTGFFFKGGRDEGGVTERMFLMRVPYMREYCSSLSTLTVCQQALLALPLPLKWPEFTSSWLMTSTMLSAHFARSI